MPHDPEQQHQKEHSHRSSHTETPALPFDIAAYLPRRTRTRWKARGLGTTSYTIDDLAVGIRPRRAQTFLNAKAWPVLKIATVLLLVFGIVGYRVWLSQASYPGTEQCYQAELWIHGVNSNLSWIRWTLEDADEEVTDETEAEASDDRVWRMYEDMRTSLAKQPAPAEVAVLKALLSQGLDLLFEIRNADQQGDKATSNRLDQELDQVIAQRLEEERRVLRSCRVAAIGPYQVAGAHNPRHMQVA